MAARTAPATAPRRRSLKPAPSRRTRVARPRLVEDDTSLPTDEHAARDAEFLNLLTRRCA